MDIDEHGFGACVGDGFCGGEESAGDCDDFIAVSDAHGEEG